MIYSDNDDLLDMRRHIPEEVHLRLEKPFDMIYSLMNRSLSFSFFPESGKNIYLHGCSSDEEMLIEPSEDTPIVTYSLGSRLLAYENSLSTSTVTT